jgi:hypothetical protein
VPVIIIPPKVMVVRDHHPSITPNQVVLVPTIQEYAATEPIPPEPVATTAVAAQAAWVPGIEPGMPKAAAMAVAVL